jgi:hypothetical protein
LRSQRITTLQLETAPPAVTEAPQSGPLTDLATIDQLYKPLGTNIGMVQVKSARQWRQLSKAAPWLGVEPNWVQGTFVGLISSAGEPLEDQPPIRWRYVRVHAGGGLVRADFSGGSYLPDGSAYLTGTYVHGLREVLLIDLSDVRYRP